MFVPDITRPLIEMNIPGLDIKHGQVLISTPNTAKQLVLESNSSKVRSGVTIKALSTNTNKVFVGGSAVTVLNGYELVKGGAIAIAVRELANVYIIGESAGDGVCFIATE